MSKRKLEAVVISDCHLGTRGSAADELLSYLKSVDPEHLILNGDIVDGWRFSKSYWPNSHSKVVRRIFKMAEKGCRVIYITGNHDEAMRHYSPIEFGNILMCDRFSLNIGGKQLMFFHGDVFDLVMASSTTRWAGKLGAWAYDSLIAANNIVNTVRRQLGMRPVRFSAKVKNSVKAVCKYVSDFEQCCINYARESNADGVVVGHIHQPKITSQDDIAYMNSGDWVESLTSLEFDGESWSIYRYEDKSDNMF